MDWSLGSDRAFSVESLVRLSGLVPVVNGALVAQAPAEILRNDSGHMILRFHHLTDAEVRWPALYAGMPGGVLMASDALDKLSLERLRLWKLLLNSTSSTCRFPFLGQAPITYARLPVDLDSHRVRHQATTEPVLVQVRGDDYQAAIFVFSTGETFAQRTYPLTTLGLESGKYLFDWTVNRSSATTVEKVAVTLAPHDGSLIFVSPTPILLAPERLP